MNGSRARLCQQQNEGDGSPLCRSVLVTVNYMVIISAARLLEPCPHARVVEHLAVQDVGGLTAVDGVRHLFDRLQI